MYNMRIENGHFFFRTGEYPCGSEFVLIPSGLDDKGRRKFTAVEIWDKIPSYEKQWKPIHGATTALKGYIWISNGKSRFDPERQTALLKEV